MGCNPNVEVSNAGLNMDRDSEQHRKQTNKEYTLQSVDSNRRALLSAEQYVRMKTWSLLEHSEMVTQIFFVGIHAHEAQPSNCQSKT